MVNKNHLDGDCGHRQCRGMDLDEYLTKSYLTLAAFAERLAAETGDRVAVQTVWNWRHKVRSPELATAVAITKITNGAVQPQELVMVVSGRIEDFD